VGSEREPIALGTPAGTFLAPDNGVLSTVIRALAPGLPPAGGAVPAALLPPPLLAIRLSSPRYRLPEVSTTFHGRDIFAPAAAHLATGVPLERLGDAVASLNLLPEFRPERRSDGILITHVVYVDRFGNLITDLATGEAQRLGQPLSFQLRGRVLPGLYRYYAEGPELKALAGSAGHVEVALRGGSAAAVLGARIGDEIEVRAGEAARRP
jgi:S-adenosylmethionine hydrolase